MAGMIGHPYAFAAVAIVGGFGLAAFILRWEFRAQMRARRYGGFLVGGDQ